MDTNVNANIAAKPALKTSASVMDTATVLLLMGVFVLLSACVMVLGVSIYRDTNRAATENYTQRTALSYVANQVRRGDADAGISVRELAGTDAAGRRVSARALVIRQVIRKHVYTTCLYVYDGFLRELFTEDGAEAELASGVAVMPLADMRFRAAGDCVAVTVTDANGRSRGAIFSPRSGMEGGDAR